ncbi:MAG: DinB family protein [Verrucomicrobiota bacterium]
MSATKLAPPGAGLPGPELFIARILFGIRRRRMDRAACSQLFRKERSTILELATTCDPGIGARPILIDRLRGIEDSSRCWSVYMTLDHLRIVNDVIALGIRTLGKGSVPGRVASTADVKPDPEAEASVISAFEKSCDLFERCVERVPDLKTAARYNHPWFGPLDAAGWHTLAAAHMAIHRKQIEKILAGASH